VPKPRKFHILDVHLSTERGALATVARVLADAKVNIDGFMANEGGVQLLTDHVDAARRALDAAAYHYTVMPVQEVLLAEKPGSLAGLCENLAWQWAHIDAGFGMATGNTARVYLQVHEEVPDLSPPPELALEEEESVVVARRATPRKKGKVAAPKRRPKALPTVSKGKKSRAGKKK
jgi:hypothetical protein